MFSIENSNMNTNLVYKLEENDQLDHTSIGMLSNNKIMNICSMKYSQLDNDVLLKFDVTSKVPAIQIFSGVLNKKWVMGLLESIYNAIKDARRYMIDLNQIVLDLNYIFMDVTTGSMDFICLPLLNAKSVDVLEFIKNIIQNATFVQNEDNRYVSTIISYVNSENKFSLESLKALTDSINNNSYSVQQNSTKPVNFQSANVSVKSNVQVPQQNVQQQGVQPQQQNFEQQNVQMPQQNPQTYSPVKNNKKNNVVTPIQKPVQQKSSVNSGQQIPVALNNNQNNEKKMSLFYLMCHYNKENVAKYKAQKNNNEQTNNFDYSVNGQSGICQNPQPINIPNNKKTSKKKANQGFVGNIPPVQGSSQPIKTNVPPVQSQSQPMQTNVPPVQSQVQPMQTNIPPVQNQVRPIQTNVPPVQSQVQPIKTNVPPVQSQSQPMQTNVPPVQSQVQPIQTNVPPVQSQVQPMQTNVPPVQNQVQPVQTNVNYSTTKADYGETTVLGGNNVYGETTVLGAESFQNEITPYLIRIKNDEKIRINKPIFRIGKEKSFVDYFIGDNTYISRGHANIICRDGHCYIVDNNSRNHTYVNGQMIASGKEVELKNGDTVKLANEAFEFKVF